MLAQDKYQAVTNEIEEIQEVRKKVDDMRVKFEKIKEKIENNWSGENKDSYIRKIDIIYESLQPIPKDLLRTVFPDQVHMAVAPPAHSIFVCHLTLSVPA